MQRVHDATGVALAATFDLELVSGQTTLIVHSAGGASRSGGVPRNADYARGLEILLRRLGALGAVLTDAYVDSTAVAALPLEERRLYISEAPYPVDLGRVMDYDGLRRGMTSAQRSIGRPSSNDKPGGNERKRTRLCLNLSRFPPSRDGFERLALVLSHAQALDGYVNEQNYSAAGAKTESRGQGFKTETASKLAVERAAMAAAVNHYRRDGWEVEDVSATESYDLHCIRGQRSLHVEVKGSAQRCARVLLTPNEVAHALTHSESVALFVLSDVTVTIQNGEATATDGTITVMEPWELDLRRLSPTGYSYALDG